MSEQKPGIYCIEGVPDRAEGEISARPMLEMLSQAHGVRFIHRVAVTRAEFFHHFMRWARRDDYDYPILYLWYHGYPNGISVNVEDDSYRTSIRFDDLTDAQWGSDYNWSDCIIHFGSCSTLAGDKGDADKFLKCTGLTAISGYTKDVGWIDGAAMELLYLNCLYDIFRENRSRKYLTQDVLRNSRRRLVKESPSKEIMRALGFDIKIRRSK